MNRRDFIKGAAALPAAGLLPLDELETETASLVWPYRVYCYERQQGEWTFSYNVRGSFAPEREYMTFDEEEPNGYLGFMYDGVLHFQEFDDATEFVWMHSRAKDDTNILDTIYDIYYKNECRCGQPHRDSSEIQVAHYWFNGDTGSQIHWEQDGFNTDWNKVESG